MRILLIEDDPDLNNQVKSSLEDSGYSVDTAVDGEEGHFLGDTEPYDAVILDLQAACIAPSWKTLSRLSSSPLEAHPACIMRPCPPAPPQAPGGRRRTRRAG